MIRRFGLAAVILLFTAFGASAGGVKPYEAGAFSDALAAGKTVLVHVHAEWCPVCRKQQPAIQSLSEDGALSDVVFLQVNFDKDRDFLTKYKVPSQSAIIVFKDGKEVARLNGVTDAGKIQSQVKAAIG